MSCPTCDELRSAWYATATPCTAQNPMIIVKVRDLDRKSADYQATLQKYREHLKSCNHFQQTLKGA